MPRTLISLRRLHSPAAHSAIIAGSDWARGPLLRGLAGQAAADFGLRVDI